MEIVARLVSKGLRVSIFTNRRLLLEQMESRFHGFDIGVFSAGWPRRDAAIQLCSIQTVYSRCFRRKKDELPHADVVIIDEAHLFKGNMAEWLFSQCETVIGVTATPVGIGNFYDILIGNGHVSVGFQCGALVPALHYGCPEPDFKDVQKFFGSDIPENVIEKVMNVPVLFGYVIEEYKRLNPDNKPTILFGPSVSGSLFFAQKFRENGIQAAHIDGENVWLDGVMYESCPEKRSIVFEGSRDGKIPIICNRFVLREGIDLPHLCHGILATAFGSLPTYIQAGGRLLRSAPGVESVVIQDHGGNWWRHGSLNADRDWVLQKSSKEYYKDRVRSIRSGKSKEPFLCPACRKVLVNKVCLCGYTVETTVHSRPIIQKDGRLVMMDGPVYRGSKSDEQRWVSLFWAIRKHSRRPLTFKQAFWIYRKRYGTWPSLSFPMMPVSKSDLGKLISTIPMTALR